MKEVANSSNVDDRENIRDRTISASVTCVFQCLSPRHGSTGALQQTQAIVEKAKVLDSRSIRSALYDGAKGFFDEYSNSKISEMAQNGCGNIDVEKVSGEVARFSSELVQGLLGPTLHSPGAEPEATRRKRVALAVAYCDSAVADEAGRLSVASDLKQWLASERSGPIRGLIEQALSSLP